MPKRKNFYKKSLSAGVLSSALFVAGCGTSDVVTEQPAESEEAEVQNTGSSGDSDEPKEDEVEQEVETETGETDETETNSPVEEDNGVPEDQAGIGTTFPLGTALSDLVDHYGTPTYDEFFMGGRLVVFDEKDGYFLDDNETVTGFMITRPDVNIFGANVGMTFEEIKTVLPNSEDVFFDESETQDYANIFYVEGYNVIFYADTEDGPTQYAIITRNK
ncbi:hypothetical protein [Planococcus sp. ISL-109]|uniref:hypothetical protein n=1 Tax=Planococcus sp. ISL-109 TaxID=2819166 RepID=UPI001BE7F4E7|nr:hypothetical protein [Planococcus sp. ISL-109]MBT2583344.1 hypothetical protein [Planococcus sp. ISL-109]